MESYMLLQQFLCTKCRIIFLSHSPSGSKGSGGCSEDLLRESLSESLSNQLKRAAGREERAHHSLVVSSPAASQEI